MNELTKAESVTNIAQGTRVTANMDTDANIRIAGIIDGDIKTSKKIILTETGRITGKVIAQEAIFEGRFTGELRVLDQITVKETAQMDGFIFSKKITVSENATVIGIMRVNPDLDVLNAKLTKAPAKSEIKEAVAEATTAIEDSGSSSEPESEQNKQQTLNRYIANVLISISGTDINEGQANSVRDASENLMEYLGFELETFDEPVFDPHYQQLTYVKKTEESASDISDHYEKIKESLESSLLNKGNTENADALQKAADQLVQTLRSHHGYCLVIGDIVLIQISEDDMQTIAAEIVPENLATDLKKNPEMVTNLTKVYSYLED